MNSPIWMILFCASQAQKNAGEAVQPKDPCHPLVFAAIFVAVVAFWFFIAWVVEKREGTK